MTWFLYDNKQRYIEFYVWLLCHGFKPVSLAADLCVCKQDLKNFLSVLEPVLKAEAP